MTTRTIALNNENFKFAIIETPSGPRKYQTFQKSELSGHGSEIMLLEVLFDNDQYGFYKEPRVLFKKADYKAPYSPDIRYDEFVKSPVYYLRSAKTYEKVKLKKKIIQKIIPEIRRTEDWKGTQLSEQKFVELLHVLSGKD
jgi:hypothetical protein